MTNSGESDPKPNTVLVVDDDAKTRAVIAKMIRAVGYEPLEAANGSEAIHHYAARSNDIAAATLDLMMPETNGRATLAMLSEIAPFLPIVISSGLDPNAERLQGRIPGTPGVTYLQKPYKQEQLKAALDKVMGQLRRSR